MTARSTALVFAMALASTSIALGTAFQRPEESIETAVLPVVHHEDPLYQAHQAPLLRQTAIAFPASPDLSGKAEPRMRAAALAMLRPAESAPRDSEDSAWFFHAWEWKGSWPELARVSFVQIARRHVDPEVLLEVDAEEAAGLAPGSEDESSAQDAGEPLIPAELAAMAPPAATLLTIGIGLAGFAFWRQRPVDRRAFSAAQLTQLLGWKRAQRDHPRLWMRR